MDASQIQQNSEFKATSEQEVVAEQEQEKEQDDSTDSAAAGILIQPEPSSLQFQEEAFEENDIQQSVKLAGSSQNFQRHGHEIKDNTKIISAEDHLASNNQIKTIDLNELDSSSIEGFNKSQQVPVFTPDTRPRTSEGAKNQNSELGIISKFDNLNLVPGSQETLAGDTDTLASGRGDQTSAETTILATEVSAGNDGMMQASRGESGVLKISVPAMKPDGRSTAQHRASPRHGNNLRAPQHPAPSPMSKLAQRINRQMSADSADDEQSTSSVAILSRDELKSRDRNIDEDEVPLTRWDADAGQEQPQKVDLERDSQVVHDDKGLHPPVGKDPSAAATSPRKTSTTNAYMLTPVKENELKIQDQLLHELHREYNNRKEEMGNNSNEISSVAETLADLEIQIAKYREVESMLATNGRVSQKQAQELDRLKRAADSKLSYVKTLKHMCERLERNKLVQDTRIEELKRANIDLEKELITHNISLREALNSERVAEADLERVRQQTTQEEAEWLDRVEARRQIMHETEEILEFREKQLAQKTAIIAQVKGDLDAEGEQNLQRKVVTNRLRQIRLQHDISKKTERIDEYERAFKRIVEATGNTSMGQIVEKFMSQADTVGNLKSMIAEAEKKIVKLSEDRHIHKKESESIRFGGLGHASKQRKLIDDKEVEIETAAKLNKHLSERTALLQNVMRGIKDGVNHIIMQLDEAQVPSVASMVTPHNADADSILQLGNNNYIGRVPSLAGNASVASLATTGPGNNNIGSNNNNGGASGNNNANSKGVAGPGGGNLTAGGNTNANGNAESVAGEQGDLYGDVDPADESGTGFNLGTGADCDNNPQAKQPSSEDVAWYLEALSQCEKRIVKVLEGLPDKGLRIDDIDDTMLDTIWRGRLASNLRSEHDSGKGSQLQGKGARIKKMLRTTKKGGASDANSTGGGGNPNGNQHPNRKSKMRPNGLSASKAAAKYKTLLGQVEKLRAHVHESSVRAQEAQQYLQGVKKDANATPDLLLKADDNAQVARADADRAQRALNKASNDLDALEATLSKSSGGGLDGKSALSGGELGSLVSDSGSEEDDDKSVEGTFEKQIPIIADKEGRELIKAETRRILKFAEKKRKRVTRLLTQRGSGSSLMATGDEEVGTLESEVVEATKLETRRFSVLRPMHSSRLALAKANAMQSSRDSLINIPQPTLQSMPE